MSPDTLRIFNGIEDTLYPGMSINYALFNVGNGNLSYARFESVLDRKK
jgi:hypothetical protein